MKSILLTLVMVVILQADYLLEFQTADGTMKFFYKDDLHEKLLPQEDICEGEIYKIKKKLYSVSYVSGRLVTVDLLKAKGFMGAMGIGMQTADPEDVAGVYDDYVITKTSKTKKIAGITAHKWILRDSQTNEKQVIYVASSKTLRKVVQGMSSLFSSFSGDSTNYFAIDGGVVVETDDMKLIKFSKVNAPKSTYKIPNRKSKVLKMCAKRERNAQSNYSEESHYTQSTPATHSVEQTVPKPVSSDPCFAKVCCGYIAGKSEVLQGYLTKKPEDMFKNFALYKVAKCSDGEVEEALYVDRTNPKDIFRIRLNMDDGKRGFVKNSSPKYRGEKKNAEEGVSWYAQGEVYASNYYTGYFLKNKMAVRDQIVKDQITLSFMEKIDKGDARATWLVDNTDQYGPMDFGKFMKDYGGFEDQTATVETQQNVHHKETKSNSDDISSDDIQNAANMLKSFF